jgi:hypothetical protein
MKRSALVLAAVVLSGVAGYLLLSPKVQPEMEVRAGEVPATPEARPEPVPEVKARESLPVVRGHDSGLPGVQPQAQEASTRVAAIAPIEDPDSPRGYLQNRLQRFIEKAQLTPNQHQQLLQVLYDVKLNWRSAFQDFTDALVTGAESDAPDGAGLLEQASKDLVRNTHARVATFLNEEQMALFRVEIGPFIRAVADATTFISDAGKVLPTP